MQKNQLFHNILVKVISQEKSENLDTVFISISTVVYVLSLRWYAQFRDVTHHTFYISGYKI